MNDGAQVIPEAINRNAIYNLADFVVRLAASEVVLALEERRNALPLGDLLRIKTTGVHVNEISTFLERETGRVDLDSVNPSWLIFSDRSEEHTSELQSLMRTSYAVFCWTKTRKS